MSQWKRMQKWKEMLKEAWEKRIKNGENRKALTGKVLFTASSMSDILLQARAAPYIAGSFPPTSSFSLSFTLEFLEFDKYSKEGRLFTGRAMGLRELHVRGLET